MAYLQWLLWCVATTNQPDTPLLFNPLNTSFSYTSWGNNAVSISYGDNNDTGGAGTDAQTIGLGFVHTIPKPKVELYAAYNHISLDDIGGVSFEDIDVFGLGTRVKFD